ncbi:hypothetical protein [uncultured Tateyamaria sp.]|uniref:hypothetical protein n=1 Tax=uncultured Tateyamaria sp. TaxID=455651 RepID=UPI00262F0F6B|nr:hypothetical protein [uncultured Tateyamaria sp.]
MTSDQDIVQEMGNLLGQLAHPAAEALIFRGKVYPEFNEGLAYWVEKDGQEKVFGSPGSEMPLALIKDMLSLAEDLLATPVFQASPFTHFTLSLDRDLDLEMDFADIPVSQNWDNLFMKPVSALTLEEAREKFIPEEDWQSRHDAVAAD